MRGFVEQLDALNALADASPGFIWRFKTPEGNATSVRPYADPLVIVNLSVWKDPASLKAYVYRGDHAAAYRQRSDWFDHLPGPALVLWWIPADTLPSLEDGLRRMKLLEAGGPSQSAFNFKSLFPPE